MLRGAEKWFPGYLASLLRRHRDRGGENHVLLCIADHFEPFQRTVLPSGDVTGGGDAQTVRRDVSDWCAAYAKTVDGIRDADGQPPRHTFFYPWDEYDPGCLDELSTFCRAGYGEVELHLHHRNDSEEGLRSKLETCRDAYVGRHGLLGRTAGGSANYAFVHGNWALCNSRPDGDWCGVPRELEILKQTGCYADFTFPSAPSPTQPRTVNAVYYGQDPEPGQCGHRRSALVKADAASGAMPDDALLFVQGPLGLNWKSRKFGILPRLENGELSAAHPATPERLALWMRLQVHVIGRPGWIIIKLHTHGMSERSRAGVIGPAMRQFHEAASGLPLHYVTARELYNIIKAAEAGHAGNPGQWRDFILKPPPFKG